MRKRLSQRGFICLCLAVMWLACGPNGPEDSGGTPATGGTPVAPDEQPKPTPEPTVGSPADSTEPNTPPGPTLETPSTSPGEPTQPTDGAAPPEPTPPAPATAAEGEPCVSAGCANDLACTTVFNEEQAVGQFCMEECDNPGGADPKCDGGESCVNSRTAGPVCFNRKNPGQGYTSPGDATLPSGGGDPATPTPPTPPTPPPVRSGPCADVPMAVGPSAPPPPSVYGGRWTPAPTEGCTFVDGEGRTVTLTDVQHRMLYRTNEVRRLQTAVDGVARPMLEADFCLQEFSQGYAETQPGGHSLMNTHLYKKAAGGGFASGGKWIGENLHMHSGSKYKDRMSSVDAAIVGWWNSGDTNRGHRGNMLNPEWAKGGMGVDTTSTGSRLHGIQTFSRNYANWTWGWTPCSNPPRVNDPMSTVPGAG